MAYHSSTINEVRSLFENRRNQALGEAEARKAKIEMEIPRIREINRSLATTAPQIMQAALSGPNWKEAFEKVKEQNLALQEERKKLLLSSGYAPDAMSPHYTCALCEDTGYINGRFCQCMREALAIKECERSGLSKLMANQSFETFDLSLYESDVRDNMEHTFHLLQQYANNFTGQNDDSWLLIGGTGLGKTHLSTSVAKEVIHRGYGVTYLSAQRLMSSFGKNASVNSDEIVQDINTCDLLIIDDLGTEFVNAFTISVLYQVINTRMTDGKSTLINTNLSIEELRERYADRITSRLLGEYRPLLFRGKDNRQKLLSRK